MYNRNGKKIGFIARFFSRKRGKALDRAIKYNKYQRYRRYRRYNWRRKRYKSRILNKWFKKHPKSKVTYIDYRNYKPRNTKTDLNWYYNKYHN